MKIEFKKIMPVLCLSIVVGFSSCTRTEKITYPETKRVDSVDEYFGQKILDPYRWLENDTSAETSEWVKAQNEITNAYLEKIPFRKSLKERFTQIWDYPKYGIPFSKGNLYFYFKNDGMQNQSVLYVQEGLEGEPRVLLDPNRLSEDGTVAIASFSVSNDARFLAYSIAKAGSDWNEIYVMDINTRQNLPDHITWIKFSGMSWKGDGFYYSRYEAPKPGEELSIKNQNQRVFYHKLGSDPTKDELIWEDPQHPLRTFGASVTEDERFLIISESESTYGNKLHIKDLQKPASSYIHIGDSFDWEFWVVDNLNDDLIVVTNYLAPRSQAVSINFSHPEISSWQTLIPEKEEVLEGIYLANGKIISQYLKDACNHLYSHNLDGQLIDEIPLPGIGTIGGFSSEKEKNIAFFAFTSFTYPTTIFKFDVEKNQTEVFRKPDIKFNSEDYTTEQVFYTSKDGTKVPMFIVHKKNFLKNGKNPTLLYGYGGFNISLTPSFSISLIPFLENGGVYAEANIRGGGEYGEEWHQAGTKMKKQNVFDDFIAAAEYLISNKYTSPKKLAINGGSNGGLLIGAVLNQRPDLFAVAVPEVGVMDMLRYHKFTIGWAWAYDYGTAEDSEEMFHYLLSYSPLHNIKLGTKYPAVMAMTADHDDRVVPAHSFKYTATLQAAQAGDAPILIRIESKAGHGAGRPTSKIIDNVTDKFSFIMYNLGMSPKF
ncbi:MAG: Prolyl endopeptidase precursor [Bacteroidetes bacterium ADurb.Bin012]|jgi:prolyl oligopeptidase|nr:MAG: Prolyl endopeptidase precursor [Bacteroidetes bacterium ADurb.Bin012]